MSIFTQQDDGLLGKVIDPLCQLIHTAADQRCLIEFALQICRALRDIASAVHDQPNNGTFDLQHRFIVGQAEESDAR